MSEVMVRNSTLRELEVNYQDYDHDHLTWAVERLFTLMDIVSGDQGTYKSQVSHLQNDLDEMEDDLNIKEEEIERLERVVNVLKDQLKTTS